MKSTKPTVSFAESLGILVALLAILGYLIIGQKLTPHIPILLYSCCCCFMANGKDFLGMRSTKALWKGLNQDHSDYYFLVDRCLSCYLDLVWDDSNNYGLWF